MNPYDKLLNRKRTWQPVQTEAGKVKEGAEETIYFGNIENDSGIKNKYNFYGLLYFIHTI